MNPTGNKDRRRRAGQAMIFTMLALVILFFVVLWNFDLHKALFVKSISQNGGDAAAVMAARWQGITLNIEGDLNVMHALALSSGDDQAVSAISNLQARLAFVGPMIGLMGAQQAAKNNGIYPNDDFTLLMKEHADEVRFEYPTQTAPDGEPLFPEPYDGAWEDYADMLDLVADDGVAAGPENMRRFTDYAGPHTLLEQAFYEAVAGRNWCWFYHNEPGLLATYVDFRSWPSLPPIVYRPYINSEIFGVGLRRRTVIARAFVADEHMAELADSRNLPGTITSTGMTQSATWYCYGDDWTAWTAMATDGEDPFPATGPLRPQYDYAGADAAIRIEAAHARLSPGPEGATNIHTVAWTAAAKPFGSLEDQQPPHRYALVLPAFHEARLIPLDAASAGSSGGYSLLWRRHIEQHLPPYLESGVTVAACWYCAQLRTWESSAFRQDGIDWLANNSDRCIARGGGPGGPGGGRRRGH